MLAMRLVHFTTNLMTLFCKSAHDAKFSTTRVSGRSADFIPETIVPHLITHAWLVDVGKVKSLSPVLGISVTKQVNDFSCFVIRVDKNWKEQFLDQVCFSFQSQVLRITRKRWVGGGQFARQFWLINVRWVFHNINTCTCYARNRSQQV